jgi:hypothetical protein
VKRNRKESKRRPQTIQVWTYDQAMGVLPYVASIMTSLREHQLEVIRHQLKAGRLDRKEGRLTRSEIIAHQETTNAAGQAEERLHAALEELHTLDVYCLDPVQGTALIPFALGDELAWFVFDVFEPTTLRHWRYHRDPVETRRAISGEQTTPPAADNSMVI